MTDTAFDRPEVEEKVFTPRAKVTTVQGGEYIVSQKMSTISRHAAEALAAGEEVKKAFFVTLNTDLKTRVMINASQIAAIEEL